MINHSPGSSSRADQLPSLLTELAARFADGAAALDRSGAFPFDNFAELHARGLIAEAAPRELGGGGATLATARRIIEAIACAEPATALILVMTYLQHRQFSRPDCRWPHDLRERVVRSAVTEGALINALRVEPELGSPSRGGLPNTVAVRHGDHWRISGHKIYCTGISALRWLAVWGRTDEPEPRVGVFLVPKPENDAPSIRILESWDHLGLRASCSHDVILDNAEIPLDHAVDLRPPQAWTPGNGSQADIDANTDQQAWQTTLLGTLYDAIAQAARNWLLTFLNERTPSSLGAPLATLPRMQETVGKIEALLNVNRVLLDEAASAADEGRPLSITRSGLMKYSVTNNAIEAVGLALKLTGNHGLTRHNPLERHHRDVLCGRIHTPQDDAILIAAGRAALAAAPGGP